MIVYAVVDDALSPDFPLGDAVETFVRRGDAERFIEEVRGDDPEASVKLRIEERELDGNSSINSSPRFASLGMTVPDDDISPGALSGS